MDLDPYPAYGQLMDSAMDWEDDLKLDRAVNGDVRGRSFYPVSKRTFSLVHALTQSEFDAFESYYESNRTNRVTLTWCPNGRQYVCLFDGPPSKPTALRPGVFKITVKLAAQ